MDYELHLAGLEIEITRDCNLNCPHCMRYEPDEPMDAYRGTVIAPEVIDALFDRYRHIELLLLTGGEPMLHPEMITYIVDKIIEKQVYVEQIQVITNGTIASKEAVTALNKAYNYITENCVDWEYPVHIGISTDYHDNQSSIQTVYNFYKQQCKFDVRLHQVDLSDAKQLALTYSGRAKALTNINEYLDPINHKICTAADGKVLCMLDLTLTGNFVLATQHSFQDADNPENILCPVDGNLLLAIMQWNYKHPLNCEEVKVKAWTQHTLDTGNYFGKKATAHDYEICKQSLEYYNDTEIYRKEVHEQFPALYPDDIENISNMSEEKSYLCCQIQATLLQRMRSSKETVDDLDVRDSTFKKTVKEDYEEVFDELELPKFTKYLAENADIANLGIMLMLVTGIRVGELAALKWDDYGGNGLKIRRTETRYQVKKGLNAYEIKDFPKTAAGARYVIIPEDCLWIMKKLKAMNPFTEFIFMKKGKRLTTVSFRNRQYRICKKIGCYPKSPHKLRKTYASLLSDYNVDPKMTIEQMGHTNISCTQGHYFRNRKSLSTKTAILSSIPELQIAQKK